MTTLEQAARQALEALEILTSNPDGLYVDETRKDKAAITALRSALEERSEQKLWLWKNGPHEYWAFDNPYPDYIDSHDPQTLGAPCGYALLKPSRMGRSDWTDESILAEIKRAALGETK